MTTREDLLKVVREFVVRSNNVRSVFSGDLLPDIALEQYSDRHVIYYRCSEAVHVEALKYVLRCRDLICYDSVHRLVAAATVVAVKFWEDEPFSNAYYASVAGLSLLELNRLEQCILHELQWALR